MRWIRNAAQAYPFPASDQHAGRGIAVVAAWVIFGVIPTWLVFVWITLPNFRAAEELRLAAETRVQRRQALPTSLEELAQPIDLHPNRWSLVTQWTLRYRRLDDTSYGLSFHRFGRCVYYYGDGAWAYNDPD